MVCRYINMREKGGGEEEEKNELLLLVSSTRRGTSPPDNQKGKRSRKAAHLRARARRPIIDAKGSTTAIFLVLVALEIVDLDRPRMNFIPRVDPDRLHKLYPYKLNARLRALFEKWEETKHIEYLEMILRLIIFILYDIAHKSRSWRSRRWKRCQKKSF